MNKVWTYIISQPLSSEHLIDLKKAGLEFVSSWTAHENKLSADFSIIKERIIMVKVNEDVHGASGCSIDKLTRFIKTMESAFGVELLNRLLVAYESEGKIAVVKSSEVKNLIETGSINEKTEIYNTSISSEDDLLNWLQPLNKTWLNKYLIKA